ncbi:MAG: hypothetical protein WC830_06665 [Burkholderiales bacterium]|jgi:hypothetical protein
MDRQTVFTKTAKGLMEATGKTSALSRDVRAVLKEIDGRATVGEVQAKLDKVPEAKLQEALQALVKSDFIREFSQAAPSAAPPQKPAPQKPAEVALDLDFTAAIPTIPEVAKKAEEDARLKAEAAARAKAAAEALARAEAEAEARAKREAEERARREAGEKARQAAEARAKAEAQARIEAEARARKEAEERARVEAELNARLEEERKARAEAKRKAKEDAERERREVEERARREADELRAKLENERKAREEAERKAKEEAERERRAAEEKARREADALRARLEEERKAREEAERRAREEAERERRETEERARREADELREKLEAERKAREEAERKAKEEAERRAKEDAERRAREEAERARREADEKARREAEEQARREAEERARKEAEEIERKAQEEAEHARREADEDARRKAEEKSAPQPQTPAQSGASLDDLVKIETDFDAVLSASGGAAQAAAQRPADADDQLQRAAEAQALRQAEEQAQARESARAEAEAEEKRAAEERRRQDEDSRQRDSAPAGTEDRSAAYQREHAQAQALLDAQNAETERHFAEMEKELEAEQAAAPVRRQAPAPQEQAPARNKKDARESARAAAAAQAESEFEPAPEPVRTRIDWGKPVALVLFLLIVLGLVLVHFVSFDGYIPQFEKLAGAYLQQPVKIKALHLSLVPRPHWRLDGVSVGNEGQLTVARVNAIAELGSMFSDRKTFSSIELESPVVGEQGLLGLLFGKPAGQDFKVASVIAKNAKLDSKTFILPALDAKIAMGEDGAWRQIALETPDHKTSLALKPDGEGAQLEVETNAFSLPFHPSFILENFVAKGVICRGELRLDELKGGIYDGYLSGKASLKWGADWSLGGEISVRAMDPGRFVPALIEEGKLEGKAVYAMRAGSYDELFEAPRLEGSFDIRKGSLLGVDLGRLLQGGGVGGKTAFSEVTGSFVREAGKTQLRQLNLVAGPVSAGGSAEADAARHISGRFAIELKSPVAHARANLALSGTLQEPRFSH